MEIIRTIDSRGEIAPLPLVELKKALDAADSGQTVELVSDDKMITGDIERYANEAGHEIESAAEDGPVMRFIIKRR